jgi:ankyrin repeat protein
MAGWFPGLTTADKELFEACARVEAERIESALYAGGRVDARDADQWTPLLALSGLVGYDKRARTGTEFGRALDALLEYGADIDAQGHGGLTCAMRASSRGDAGLLAALLARGAKTDGCVAMAAGCKNCLEVVELLLAAGARMDDPDSQGRLPGELARKCWPAANESFVALHEAWLLRESVKCASAKPEGLSPRQAKSL